MRLTLTGKADLPQAGLDTSRDFRGRQPLDPQSIGYVLEGGQVREQSIILEHETDIPFSQVGPFAFIESGYFNTNEQETAAIRIVEQTEYI